MRAQRKIALGIKLVGSSVEINNHPMALLTTRMELLTMEDAGLRNAGNLVSGATSPEAKVGIAPVDKKVFVEAADRLPCGFRHHDACGGDIIGLKPLIAVLKLRHEVSGACRMVREKPPQERMSSEDRIRYGWKGTGRFLERAIQVI